MKFCIEFVYYSATCIFQSHPLPVHFMMTQTTSRLQKSLPDREGTGTLPPRRWGNSWGGVRGEMTRVTPSGPTTTRTTLTLSPLSSRASINAACLELFMLRVIFAMSCKFQWVHVYLWIKLLMSWEFAPVCLYFPGFFPQVVIVTHCPLVLTYDERMIIHLDVNHMG